MFSSLGYKKTSRGANIIISPFFKNHGIKQHEYHYLCTTTIRNCILYDVRKGINKFGLEQKKYSDSLNNNVARHKIADDVLEYVVYRKMHLPDAIDDCGGKLQYGIHFTRHSLFSISLDRKNNSFAHFLKDKPITFNIHVICKGFNNSSNIVSKYGFNTCQMLREKIRNQHAIDIQECIERESASKSQLYNCCRGIWYKKTKNGIWNDILCREYFKTFRLFFEYCLLLLQKQQGRCEISEINLEGKSASEDFFKLSIDAIKPKKGHIKDNIRIICRFLNSTNHDKSKKIEDVCDFDNHWTKISFKYYISL
jgi:hypothetical protein